MVSCDFFFFFFGAVLSALSSTFYRSHGVWLFCQPSPLRESPKVLYSSPLPLPLPLHHEPRNHPNMRSVDRINILPTGEFVRLTINEDRDPNNPDAPSPNAMMVDTPEEHLVEPNGTENDNNVAIINTDTMESDALLATDCMPATLPAYLSFPA